MNVFSSIAIIRWEQSLIEFSSCEACFVLDAVGSHIKLFVMVSWYP